MIIDGGVHVESQGVELETTAEADMFDVALEEVVKGRRGTTGAASTTSARRRIKSTALAIGRSLR